MEDQLLPQSDTNALKKVFSDLFYAELKSKLDKLEESFARKNKEILDKMASQSRQIQGITDEELKIKIVDMSDADCLEDLPEDVELGAAMAAYAKELEEKHQKLMEDCSRTISDSVKTSGIQQAADATRHMDVLAEQSQKNIKSQIETLEQGIQQVIQIQTKLDEQSRALLTSEMASEWKKEVGLDRSIHTEKIQAAQLEQINALKEQSDKIDALEMARANDAKATIQYRTEVDARTEQLQKCVEKLDQNLNNTQTCIKKLYYLLIPTLMVSLAGLSVALFSLLR